MKHSYIAFLLSFIIYAFLLIGIYLLMQIKPPKKEKQFERTKINLKELSLKKNEIKKTYSTPLVRKKKIRKIKKTAKIKKRKVFIVSAIGDAAGFSKTVEKMGFTFVGEKIFPDHFNYSQSNWKNVEALSTAADYIITTEKDWVKIESFPIFKPIIVIEINVKISPQDILEKLLKVYCGIHFS